MAPRIPLPVSGTDDTTRFGAILKSANSQWLSGWSLLMLSVWVRSNRNCGWLMLIVLQLGTMINQSAA